MKCRYAVFFLRDDSGAATVDWVVISGAAVGMALIVLIPFGYSTKNATQQVADQIGAVSAAVAAD